MTKVKNVGEVYKCKLCGNVVEVKKVGGGELVCCGQVMEKQ
jgi:desulfoferrodoxin-like iron-binding protein